MIFKCSKCGKDLEQVTDLSQLIAMPFDWYKKPEVLEKNVILQCRKCKMFRVLNSIDKMKWRIANKLMGGD